MFLTDQRKGTPRRCSGSTETYPVHCQLRHCPNWAALVLLIDAAAGVQLFRGRTQAACPTCKAVLPHMNVEAYKPNYQLMTIIDSLRSDPITKYRLARERLRFERSQAARLGAGGSSSVFCGAALACVPLLACGPLPACPC